MRFAVMKHLAVLEAAGLVLVRREGRERWNHLNAVPLQRMYERWMSPYQAHRAGALLALSRAAERPKGEPVMPATPKSPVAAGTIVIEQEVEIAAPPARVFEALTTDLAAWWGVAVFDLARQGAGARLRLSHRVLGEVNEELRASYHGGWGDLLGTRLKGFVETGARSGLAR